MSVHVDPSQYFSDHRVRTRRLRGRRRVGPVDGGWGASLRQHGRDIGVLLCFQGLERGRVFDVGAGSGFVLAGLAESGWGGQGLDPCGASAELARSTLGVDVLCGSIDDGGAGDRSRHDVLSVRHGFGVGEEFAEVAASVRNMVHPGGHLLIEACRGIRRRRECSHDDVAERLVRCDVGFDLVASGRSSAFDRAGWVLARRVA